MKNLLKISLVTSLLLVGASASQRDTTFNIYGVGAKTDKNQNSSYGAGLSIDSEEFKGKFEATQDFFKTGLMYKFNPLPDYYLKVGANYINQKIYAPDNTNAKVNQFSGALALGFMLDDLDIKFIEKVYIEVGGAYTTLQGTKIGNDYEMKDEDTSLAYLEVATRVGDFDFSANAGEVFYEYKQDEFSYGVGADYYLGNAKFGYSYQNEKNNIANTYSLEYGYLYVEVVDNLSYDTYQASVGARIAFTDIADFSTYQMPNNGRRHLSELHKFESVAFGTNMSIQSGNGVQRTDESLAREEAANNPAVSSPTINAIATQNVNDNGGGLATTLLTVSGSNINAGAVFSIVADPTSGGLTINSSSGELIWNKNIGGGGVTTYSITIKVINTDGGSDTETFTLNVTDNL